MLPVNPFPIFKVVRPLFVLGVAAGAAALAVWAARNGKAAPTGRKSGRKLIRVEHVPTVIDSTCEVPWGTEVR